MMVLILGILFVLVVAPIWIVAHYATHWRTGRMLSREHERALADLAELATKLEARMDALERALGPEAGGGR